MDPRGSKPDTSLGSSPSEAQQRMIDQVRRAIVAAADGTGASDGFQAGARELVGEWRRANVPAEQVLLRMKAILADAGLRPTYATQVEPRPPVGSQTEIYRDVVAWTIRHYYESEKSGP
jgi:hypothetical protein